MSRPADEVRAELKLARQALHEALTAQSYSLDTGQGRQQVTRATISEIRALISDLEAELSVAEGGGLRHGRFWRF